MVGIDKTNDRAPPIAGILETCLYVDDLGRARNFYERIMGLEPVFEAGHMAAYRVGGRAVLILFLRGSMRDPVKQAYGTIPAHDGTGPLHFCFVIPSNVFDSWRDWLNDNNIVIVSEVDWPGSPGRSLYFEDPDGHMAELATPGLWGIADQSNSSHT